jgi:ADP-ribose pyrophosphatase
MRVREDTIRRANGDEGIFGVVEKPDFAVIVPVDQGCIYLVEQYRYPVEGRFWELPQGSWEDRPVVDPYVLATAELREETGLLAASMTHVGHLFTAYGYSNQGYDVFLASGLTTGERALDAEEEGLISRAFTKRETERMILDGVIKDATTVASIGLLKLKNLI